jgi:hypothetical protein
VEFAYIASVLLKYRALLAEYGLAEFFPTIDSYGDCCDFIAIHLSN